MFENPEVVPIIGEMMPSRWAYEAVAVHQFKGNRFTREFFEIDQARYNASYQAEYINEIKRRLNEIWWLSRDGPVPESCAGDLLLIQNELKDLSNTGVVASFGSPDGFTCSGFNEAVFQTAIDSLNRARQVFQMPARATWNSMRRGRSP